MTTEEKAKAYDEALGRAKEMRTTLSDKAISEYIFPELKESEDERIRKWLEGLIEAMSDNSIEFKDVRRIDVLHWLEKQGEQKHTIEMKTPEESLGIDSATYNKIVDEVIYGEQKLSNKVEPKFKVGDWIVGANSVYKVVSLNDELSCYIVNTVNNEEIKIPYYFDCGPNHMCSYHLWTIQDAKDGDVLAASDGSIFLFKCVIDCGCKHYVALTTDNTIKFNEGLEHCWESSRAVHPATKEQRDLLFSKMKEADYELDAVRKV